MRRLHLLALLIAVSFFSGACSRSGAVSDNHAAQSARQPYLGAWRNVSNGETITIEENGANLLLRLQNDETTAGAVASDGSVETGFGRMSIEQTTGHLTWINGEYERVTTGAIPQ